MSSKAPLLGGSNSNAAGTGADKSGISLPRSNPAAASAPDYIALGGGEQVSLRGTPLESPIDFGFEHHVEFNRGVVEFRKGSDHLNLESLQASLGCGTTCCSLLGMLATAATGFGIPYLLAKCTLVRRGDIGMVEWINGTNRVLGPGWHLTETFCTSVSKHRLTSDFIEQGSLKIIRINPGYFGLALQNGKPVVLMEGRHLVNDPLFSYQRAVAMTDAHISVGTVHLITVQQGQVGLCLVESTAHFLEPGMHQINHPRFTFSGFKNSTDEHISIGSKHRIIVPAGKIGLAWENGEPLILDPGRVYNIDKPNFMYVGSKSVMDFSIIHGRLKIITCKQGYWAISFDEGVLKILLPGRHTLDKPSHYVAGFLSTGQQVLPIAQVTSMTSDNVGIIFDAAVTVRIVDPAKAVVALGTADDQTFNSRRVNDTIVQKAKLALSIIIGNNRLNNTFRSTTRAARGTAKAQQMSAFDDSQPVVVAGASTAGSRSANSSSSSEVEDPIILSSSVVGSSIEDESDSFKQVIHDVFMHDFSEKMLQECGVAIVDMSIEDVSITNADLAKAMAQGAVARTNLIKAQIETEVAKAHAMAEQASEILRAEGEARAITITAQAEAQRTRVMAEAEAGRIRKIDEAMATVSKITQQREIIRASGEVLSASKASLVLAHSAADVANLLGSGGGGAGSLFSSAGIFSDK